MTRPDLKAKLQEFVDRAWRIKSVEDARTLSKELDDFYAKHKGEIDENDDPWLKSGYGEMMSMILDV